MSFIKARQIQIQIYSITLTKIQGLRKTFLFGNLIIIPDSAKNNNDRPFEVVNAYMFLGFKGSYDAQSEFSERIDASRCILMGRREGESHGYRRDGQVYILH